jgi:hypothetical protein
MSGGDDVRDTVRSLLAAAGLSPSEDEIDELTLVYPALRAAADGLYVPEASAYLPLLQPSASSDLEAQ